ncbi:MAG: outer membrane protein assembly factor BamA [Pseudomonadota bacterium]
MIFNSIRLMACRLMIALALGTVAMASHSVTFPQAAHAAVVSSVQVQGSQRLDNQSILNYITIEPGRSFSTIDIDDSLKALFATGLFADVQIFQSGRTLIVRVEENPTIANVIIRGNKKIKTEPLRSSLQSEDIGILSDNVLESDRQRIEEQYRRIGREDVSVNVRTVELANNRVNVVFEIAEGGRTRVKQILFVGNNAFGDRRLRSVINTKQSSLLSFISRNDVYDPDRLAADEEILARFYFDRGYADFEVISAIADLDQAENEYTITITVNEGERYDFGDVQIDSTIEGLDPEQLQRELKSRTGRLYSAKRVEETIEGINNRVASKGFAFAQITPRGERNFDTRTIDVVYIIDEGPRAYIERINIVGNERTRDYVIRREFDIAEGDAYNQVLIDAARRRLDALGFFESVRITTSQGSAPDRVVLNVNVKDKNTGSFTIGAGYSNNDGVVGNVSLSERNFLGRGQFIKVAASLGGKTSNYEFAFTEPYFLGRRLAAGFTAYNRTEDFTTSRPYNSQAVGGSVSLGVPLTQRLTASLIYSLESDRITYQRDNVGNVLGNGAAFVQEGTTVTSALGYELVYDGLDDQKNPRDGILVRFGQTFAGIGGNVRYLQTTAQLVGYKSVMDDSDIVLFGNLRGGHTTGVGQRVRYQDNFAINSRIIRGFEPGAVGPFSQAINLHVGSTEYIAVSGEVQFPVPGLSEALGVRGALFADAAWIGSASPILEQAVNGSFNANLTGQNAIRSSVGLSVIWDSPIGPLRGDFAHAINKVATDRTQFFNFGISTQF